MNNGDSIVNCNFTRRAFVASMSAAIAGCQFPASKTKAKFAFNPSTFMKFQLPLAEQVRLAAEAGFRGLEPWLKDVRTAAKNGQLADLRKLATDLGIEFINGIAFGQWSHPDAKIRAAGLEETKRDMAMLAQIGCTRIAASMCGIHAQNAPEVSLAEIAERYAALLELGKREGVRPLLEYWGHSKVMNRPEDAIAVLEMVKSSEGAILADVFHTYAGGGSFASFARFTPQRLPVLHVNDYPNRPGKELADADRVWPGDGVAPWKAIREALHQAGNDSPWLSLELFNQSYQTRTAQWTVRSGHEKMSALWR